jgi:hypothetical protein
MVQRDFQFAQKAASGGQFTALIERGQSGDMREICAMVVKIWRETLSTKESA